MATFTYVPDFGPSPELTPRILKASFGDGYEQRAEAGLNPYMPTWNLTFSIRSETEAKAIAAWLQTNKAASTPFDWTAPDGTTGKWIADKWTPARPDSHNAWSVAATFRKVTG